MCLNQVLKNEQITIMRHAVATASGDVGRSRRKLNLFEKLLKAHPYPHRPYSPLNEAEGGRAGGSTRQMKPAADIGAWENEGGAC